MVKEEQDKASATDDASKDPEDVKEEKKEGESNNAVSDKNESKPDTNTDDNNDTKTEDSKENKVNDWWKIVTWILIRLLFFRIKNGGFKGDTRTAKVKNRG